MSLPLPVNKCSAEQVNVVFSGRLEDRTATFFFLFVVADIRARDAVHA